MRFLIRKVRINRKYPLWQTILHTVFIDIKNILHLRFIVCDKKNVFNFSFFLNNGILDLKK